MSTHASISIARPDGTYASIYLHYDGYISHAGKLLVENYNSTEKVEALISLGSLSQLAESVECPEGHSFETPIEGFCVAYARDRREELEICEYSDDVRFKVDTNFSYNYLWDGERWLWRPHVEVGKRLSDFKVLTLTE